VCVHECECQCVRDVCVHLPWLANEEASCLELPLSLNRKRAFKTWHRQVVLQLRHFNH